MERILFVLLAATALSVALGFVAVPLLGKLKAGQVVLGYVEEHKSKSGTPTMGGLFFFAAAAISYFIFRRGQGRIAVVCLAIGGAYMAVGFLDDFLKIRNRRNMGLKPWQKIVFQVLIAAIGGAFAYRNAITSFYVPFTGKIVDIGWWFIPLAVFVFLAASNCVNLTDGLDGLAGGVSAIYLAFIAVYLVFTAYLCQTYYLANTENFNLIVLCCAMVGALLGFLVFNTNKASVFMGDTGSLMLGGMIAAISLFGGFVFFLPLLGIMYVLSGISVIMQVAWFKRTGRRIFLMAPLHHHFQKKGYGEGKICFCYGLVTAATGAALLISFL